MTPGRVARFDISRKTRWTALFLFFVPLSAEAFQPVTRSLAPTPERFVITTPDDAEAPFGLRIASRRRDGSPALLHATRTPPPRNLDPARAAELALGIASQLALGASQDNLQIAGVTALDGWLTVTLSQTHRGIPVRDGVVVLVFREGHLMSVRNELVLAIEGFEAKIPANQAQNKALEAARGLASDSTLAADAALEYWAPNDFETRLAYKTRARSFSPRSELTIYVDATDGTLLAADDEVRWADGEGLLRLQVEPDSAGDAPAPITAQFLGLGTASLDNDGEGRLQAPFQATYSGRWAEVQDQSGQALERFDVDFSGPYAVHTVTPARLSQADPFVHTNVVKSIARRLTPSIAWVDRQLTVNVNINDVCNAFWDGSTINFYSAGGGCENSGRIASIVYHEFGHGYHQYLTQRIVGSIGEGTGDFLAASSLDDAVIGRGFRADGGGIRRLDRPRVYPADLTNQVHEDGLIWATALWNLRAALHTKHGAVKGNEIVQRIFVRALTQGPGLASAYPAVLTGDDDDNDVSNGTPNSCEINEFFGANGLIQAGQINHTPAPVKPFAKIEHVAPGVFDEGAVRIEARIGNASSCGAIDPTATTLHWAREGEALQQIVMTTNGAVASAEIPGLSKGTAFVYWIENVSEGVTFREGSEASPHRGVVNQGERIFGETFEDGASEWRHGTVGSDLHDDWQVGAPHGTSGDPIAAKEGSNVAGTDLGRGARAGETDGAAKAGRHTFFESPVFSSVDRESLRLDFWEHYTVAGTRRVIAGGETVFEASSGASGGWRFRSIALPVSLEDRGDLTIRFELETEAGNIGGGWTIDDLSVHGVPSFVVSTVTPPRFGVSAPSAPPNVVLIDPGTKKPRPEPPAGEAPLRTDALLTRGALNGGCTCLTLGRTPSAASILGFLALILIRKRALAR